MSHFCIYLIPLFALLNTLLSCYLVIKVIAGSPRWRSALAESIVEAFPLQQVIDNQLDASSLASFHGEALPGVSRCFKKAHSDG